MNASPSRVAKRAGPMRLDEIADDPVARIRHLADRSGVESLQDAELLALCLARSGRVEALPRALALLDLFGGLAAVLGADRAGLERQVGPEAALDLKLLRETAVRLAAAVLPGRDLMTSWGQVADYLKTLLMGRPREEFWVLFLDRQNRLIRAERLGVGTVDHAPVYPREVLRRALELNACAMILAHNHPSGDPTPSRADLDVTRQIIQAGKVLAIAVHDHVIVGGGTLTSLRSAGLI